MSICVCFSLDLCLHLLSRAIGRIAQYQEYADETFSEQIAIVELLEGHGADIHLALVGIVQMGDMKLAQYLLLEKSMRVYCVLPFLLSHLDVNVNVPIHHRNELFFPLQAALQRKTPEMFQLLVKQPGVIGSPRTSTAKS